MVKPTPSQEENDRAALGEHVLVKEPDGSGIDHAAAPAEDVVAPEAPGAEPKRKQMEPVHTGGYQTKTMTPQPSPPRPAPQTAQRAPTPPAGED